MSRSCTVGVLNLLAEAYQLLELVTRIHMTKHEKASHNQGYSILNDLLICSEAMAGTWQIGTNVDPPQPPHSCDWVAAATSCTT